MIQENWNAQRFEMVASVEEAREANPVGFGEVNRLREAMLIHSEFKLDKKYLRDPSKVPDQIHTWLCFFYSTRLFVIFSDWVQPS